MKIAGVLCWYDESPATLAVAVAGMARVCDVIVAVDGAYALFPGARARSHPDQAEAILNAAETQGAACLVHRPNEVFFGNEVEKRQLSVDLAGRLLTPGRDWVLVFDADFQLMICEPDLVRQTLEETERNVVTYTILDGADLLADPATFAVALADDVDTEWTVRDREIFRYTDDLAYGPAHYFVSGSYGYGLEWLRGPDMSADAVAAGAHPAGCDHLGRSLVVVHRRSARARVRQDAADGYYRLRDQQRLEEISPATLAGLPV